MSGFCREIQEFRNNQAIVLGFNNYADLVMESKMAANVDNVYNMINNLLVYGNFEILFI